VYRKYQRGDLRSYDLVSAFIRSELDVFAAESVIYLLKCDHPGYPAPLGEEEPHGLLLPGWNLFPPERWGIPALEVKSSRRVLEEPVVHALESILCLALGEAVELGPVDRLLRGQGLALISPGTGPPSGPVTPPRLTKYRFPADGGLLAGTIRFESTTDLVTPGCLDFRFLVEAREQLLGQTRALGAWQREHCRFQLFKR
jgi:hypothetical protein